jgi:phosphonate transport system ATP-binding protein
MSSPTMIDARGISKSYQRGVPVLDDVTLSLRRGEMVALIGASGSGKSTLIRAIAGLTPIDGSRNGTAGTIEMMGEPIQRDGRLNTGRALRARIGVIFQQFNLVPRLSVLTETDIGQHRQPRHPRPVQRRRQARGDAGDGAGRHCRTRAQARQ